MGNVLVSWQCSQFLPKDILQYKAAVVPDSVVLWVLAEKAGRQDQRFGRVFFGLDLCQPQQPPSTYMSPPTSLQHLLPVAPLIVLGLPGSCMSRSSSPPFCVLLPSGQLLHSRGAPHATILSTWFPLSTFIIIIIITYAGHSFADAARQGSLAIYF